MTRITLVCAAGMSTSLLVSKMNMVAVKTGASVKFAPWLKTIFQGMQTKRMF